MKHWKLPVLAVIVIAVAVLTIPGSSPVRKTVFLVRHMQCFKRPHDGGGVAAIGDSITAGTSDPDWGFLGSNSWFDQIICDGQPRYAYNAGVPFQTTEMVSSRLDNLIRRDPDVVVILTGTNDILKGLPLPHAITLIASMIDRLRRARITPVLATVPPFKAAPATADRFDALLIALAQRERVQVLDFHSVLAQHDEYRTGLTDDGLHPNVEGSKRMAQLADPILERLEARAVNTRS